MRVPPKRKRRLLLFANQSSLFFFFSAARLRRNSALAERFLFQHAVYVVSLDDMDAEPETKFFRFLGEFVAQEVFFRLFFPQSMGTTRSASSGHKEKTG